MKRTTQWIGGILGLLMLVACQDVPSDTATDLSNSEGVSPITTTNNSSNLPDEPNISTPTIELPPSPFANLPSSQTRTRGGKNNHFPPGQGN